MSSQSFIFNPREDRLSAAGVGFQVPRLTTDQRLALSVAAGDAGMLVFDVDQRQLYVWSGYGWEAQASASVVDFGAEFTTSNGSRLYDILQNSTTSIGGGDFSVWIRFLNPSWSASVTEGIWQMEGLTSPANARYVQCNGTSSFLQFLLRSTTGSSTITPADVNSASSFIASPNPLASLPVNSTVDLVFTRTNGTLKVYVNGADVTASFSFNSGWGDPWLTVNGIVCQNLAVSLFAGNLNYSQFFISKPIAAARVWNSVLTSAQAAKPSTTSGSFIDISGRTTEVSDATDAFRDAILSVYSRGGGMVTVPTGNFRIDGTVPLWANVWLIGERQAQFFGSRTYRLTNLVGTSATLPVVEVDIAYVPNGDTNLFPTTSAGGATITNRYHNGGLSDLSITTSGGNCVNLTKVSTVGLSGLSLLPRSGYALLCYSCNGIRMDGIFGSPVTSGRGFLIHDTADCIIDSCNWGGAQGPSLWLAGNSNTFTGSQFWNSQNPGTTWKLTFTFAGQNLTVTGHPFKTGDYVTLSSTGTIPTGLSVSEGYWVYVVDANTIRLNRNRDQALAGVGIVPAGGVGTQSVQPGPVSNLCIGFNGTIINNSFVSGRLDQSYEHGAVLSGATGNVISGTILNDNWLGNFTTPNRPAIQFVNGATNNSAWGCEYFNYRSNISAGVNNASSADATSTNNRTDRGSSMLFGFNSQNQFTIGRDTWSNVLVSGIFEVASYTTVTRSRTANVVTLVTSRPHNLATGQTAGISGLADATFNVNAASVTVVDSLTFTYTAAGADVATVADTGGTVTPNKGFAFGSGVPTAGRLIMGVGGLSNNRTLYLGPSSVDSQTNASGTTPLILQGGIGVGGGIQIGSNGSTVTRVRRGRATLVAGTVTVADTNVTASSDIQLTSNADGGTPGWLRVSARVAGASFTITSSSGTDTSSVAWLLIEP